MITGRFLHALHWSCSCTCLWEQSINTRAQPDLFEYRLFTEVSLVCVCVPTRCSIFGVDIWIHPLSISSTWFNCKLVCVQLYSCSGDNEFGKSDVKWLAKTTSDKTDLSSHPSHSNGNRLEFRIIFSKRIKMSNKIEETSYTGDLMRKVGDLKEMCDVTLISGIDKQK